MKFRTEIEIRQTSDTIEPDERLVSLGSCFSQAIGNRLEEGGLDIKVTPMGVLFNPISIAKTIEKAFGGSEFTEKDLYRDSNEVYHALDFESRRQDADPGRLLHSLNEDFNEFRNRLLTADRWLITFGTAWCFRHIPTARIVGNCHKLPDSEFERKLCSIDEIVSLWDKILERAPKTIFTVSPVRHLNDGLHGNTLSKARLHLALEELCRMRPNAQYFPAYEALVDDLRDYRFYADDLKHPSTMAEEYIFDLFSTRFFTKETRVAIEEKRRQSRQTRHRPIIR